MRPRESDEAEAVGDIATLRAMVRRAFPKLKPASALGGGHRTIPVGWAALTQKLKALIGG